MEYMCPKCGALLKKDNQKYICEYCKSEFNKEYFKYDVKSNKYIIPFKTNKKEAIKIYKKHIKSTLLTPSKFLKRKTINSIKGFYIPCYLYSINATGVIEYNGDKISTWKSSGIKYKKTDTYKVSRSANLSLKKVCFLRTKEIDEKAFEEINTYDYEKLIPFDPKYLENFNTYTPDKLKKEILESINLKIKNIFTYEVSKDIKEYDHLNLCEDSINIDNPTKEKVLVPIWLFTINYKGKKYTNMINGQTGSFYGHIKTNYKRFILIFIAFFLLIFILLFLVNLVGVIL